MSTRRHAALLLALTAGFTLSTMLLSSQTETTLAAPQQQEAPPLTSLHVGEIQGFTLRQGDSVLGVIPHGTAFEIVGDETPYNPDKLAAFLYAACHLTAERILEAPDSAEAYGLEPPYSQISLLYGGEAPLRIRIGALCPISDQRYATVEGSGSIALLPADISELLAAAPEDLRDLRLFPAVDGTGQAQLQALTLSTREDSFTLRRVEGSVSGLLSMASPVAAATDWQAVNDRLLIPLSTLEPTRFLSDAADAPAAFGLDDPDYTLTLTYDGETVHCLFRLDANGESCYCFSPEQGRVCSLPADSVSFLSLSYADLLGGTIYRQAIAGVDHVSITDGSQEELVSFSGSGETLSARHGNTLLDAMDASRFYSQVTAIPLAGTLTEDAAPSAAPLLTLTVTLKDGQADILEFLPLSPQYCALSVNGVCQFATYATVPALMMQRFQALGG